MLKDQAKNQSDNMANLANMLQEQDILFKNELSCAKEALLTAVDEKEKTIILMDKQFAMSQMQISKLRTDLASTNQSLANLLEKENLIGWIKKHDTLQAELLKTRQELKESINTNIVLSSQLAENDAKNVENTSRLFMLKNELSVIKGTH